MVFNREEPRIQKESVGRSLFCNPYSSVNADPDLALVIHKLEDCIGMGHFARCWSNLSIFRSASGSGCVNLARTLAHHDGAPRPLLLNGFPGFSRALAQKQRALIVDCNHAMIRRRDRNRGPPARKLKSMRPQRHVHHRAQSMQLQRSRRRSRPRLKLRSRKFNRHTICLCRVFRRSSRFMFAVRRQQLCPQHLLVQRFFRASFLFLVQGRCLRLPRGVWLWLRRCSSVLICPVPFKSESTRWLVMRVQHSVRRYRRRRGCRVRFDQVLRRSHCCTLFPASLRGRNPWRRRRRALRRSCWRLRLPRPLRHRRRLLIRRSSLNLCHVFISLHRALVHVDRHYRRRRHRCCRSHCKPPATPPSPRPCPNCPRFLNFRCLACQRHHLPAPAARRQMRNHFAALFLRQSLLGKRAQHFGVWMRSAFGLVSHCASVSLPAPLLVPGTFPPAMLAKLSSDSRPDRVGPRPMPLPQLVCSGRRAADF